MGKEEMQPNLERRKLLKLLGFAGGAVAATSLIGPFQAAAATGRHNILNVSTVSELDQLEALKEGDLVFVEGYSVPGDGGAKVLRWVEKSTRPVDGGLVHKLSAQETGRFEVVHDGTADYRWFGILDDSKPADDAFDAMAADETITEIRAYSDLHFYRRHTIRRSRLTLDFQNHRVLTRGIAEIENRPMEEQPLFFFTGTPQGAEETVTLREAMPEYTDVFEAPSFSAQRGDWFLLTSDACNLPGFTGKSAREIQRIVQLCDDFGYESGVRRWNLNYRTGYALAANRTLTYQAVKPIEDITVKNLRFEGNGADARTGCHPLAFYYAVRCNVSNMRCFDTYAAAIMRMYNSNYLTENCSLVKAPDITTGGRGYLTQQMYCNYGTVRNCNMTHGRHLNDFTASSYMLVENCHVNYDYMGGYVTHGQFEHDLTYIGNSGLMSFANSGAAWGESAKNITVKRHTGCNLNAGNRITNLTLEDCHIFFDAGPMDSGSSLLSPRVNGTIYINCDGASIKNCSASHMLYLVDKSSLSARPNVIENSSFGLRMTETGRNTSPYFAMGWPVAGGTVDSRRVEKAVTFRGCEIKEISDSHCYINAPLTFENCTLSGGSPWGKMEFISYDLLFRNCTFQNVTVVVRNQSSDTAKIPAEYMLMGLRSGRLRLHDCLFYGSSTEGLIKVAADTNAPVQLELLRAHAGNTINVLADVRGSSKLLGLRVQDCAVSAGKTTIASGTFRSGAYCFVTGNSLGSHQLQGLPSGAVIAQNVPSNPQIS